MNIEQWINTNAWNEEGDPVKDGEAARGILFDGQVAPGNILVGDPSNWLTISSYPHCEGHGVPWEDVVAAVYMLPIDAQPACNVICRNRKKCQLLWDHGWLESLNHLYVDLRWAAGRLSSSRPLWKLSPSEGKQKVIGQLLIEEICISE